MKNNLKVPSIGKQFIKWAKKIYALVTKEFRGKSISYRVVTDNPLKAAMVATNSIYLLTIIRPVPLRSVLAACYDVRTGVITLSNVRTKVQIII